MDSVAVVAAGDSAACRGGSAEFLPNNEFPRNYMSVNLPAPQAGDLHPVAGVRIGVAEAGIRKANRKDLTVVLIDAGACVAGVFTQNRFCAAPVQVCRQHLATGDIRAMVINTGNANAGTGEDGLVRARSTCIALARRLEVAPEQVLPFSTGVIMEQLPVERIEAYNMLEGFEGDPDENAQRGKRGGWRFRGLPWRQG